MTFKDFLFKVGTGLKNGAVGFYNLPGTLASGAATVVFGDPSINYVEDTIRGNSFKKDTKIQYLVNEKNEYLENEDGDKISPTIFTKMKKYGLIGTIGNGIVAVGSFAGKALLFIGDLAVRALTAIAEFAMKAVTWVAGAITNFVSNHKKAITNIFWITLALAATAAVIGAIVAAANPVAFAAFVGFTVGGVSIASIAGASVAAQIGVTAAIVAAATVITSGIATTLYNGISFLAGWVKEHRNPLFSIVRSENEEKEGFEFINNDSSKKINSSLNSSNTIEFKRKDEKKIDEVKYFENPLNTKKKDVEEEININDNSSKFKLGNGGSDE